MRLPFRTVLYVVGLALLFAAGGCGRDSAGADTDTANTDASLSAIDASYPAPRSDLVTRIGSDTSVDIAAWNIENFPKAPQTPSLMADLITSLDLDFITVEEIENVAAFDELIARLPEHEGILSTHTYRSGSFQKIGFIYRSALIEVRDTTLLFEGMSYEFPRPPMQAELVIDDGVHPAVNLLVIGLHLKAGFGSDDRSRRQAAMLELDRHVRAIVDAGDETELLLLGDFNEIITSSAGRAAMAPWLDDPARYTVLTKPLADAGDVSFLPTGRIIDHMVATVGLDDELEGGVTLLPRLDQQLFGYEGAISDHLPIFVSLPILR